MKTVTIWQQVDPTFREDQPTTHMVKVCSFQTDLPLDDALTEAFRLTNLDGPDEPWETNPALTMEPVEHRSTSVGDVVVIDGQAYQCQRRGWKRLDRFEPQ